ncbi:MAG TPA: deoxyguanosinetriphosphate triphosphohydrolase [Chloroflexota bacterium]|nr:deoxyguanosinetriphosphate triphosphohydrolase [Chloroflexota bacterium]
MIVRREDLERREDRNLAPYALPSARSRGRQHLEPPDLYRTAFQRDRDRVIHSAAYRRLGNKTQVFISFEGEHYRTRLTHTEEATQIAVSVARALAANVDLTEAISRAHDLGHAPFGHAGEEVLAARMDAFGGFEHNRQTLRIVEELEEEYPDFRGLNLTAEVREGILAHRGDNADDSPGPDLQPSLEAQIADVADEIAYGCHDLQDGLAAGVLDRAELTRDKPTWWADALAALSGRGLSSDMERRRVKGYLINHLVSDLIENTAQQLANRRITSPEEVRRQPERIVDFSPAVRAQHESLRRYLFANLYRHYEVVTMAEKAKRLLGELFDAYRSNPDQLPEAVHPRLAAGTPLERAICDHLASLTDRGAVREHRRLFDVEMHILP